MSSLFILMREIKRKVIPLKKNSSCPHQATVLKTFWTRPILCGWWSTNDNNFTKHLFKKDQITPLNHDQRGYHMSLLPQPLRKCRAPKVQESINNTLNVRRIGYFVMIFSVIKKFERAFLPAGSQSSTWFCFTERSAVSSAVSLRPECVYMCVWMWAGCALGRQSESPGGFSLSDHKLWSC